MRPNSSLNNSAKVYLIDEHPPFKGGSPFPPFHPPLKKGGPPFEKVDQIRVGLILYNILTIFHDIIDDVTCDNNFYK